MSTVVDASAIVQARVDDADDDDADYAGCEERSDDGDDDGSSLKSFIADDENEDDAESDADTVISEPPATHEEAIQQDLDGISQDNIVYGRRTRRPPQRLTETIMAGEDYRRMMLCDVPDDEMEAALEDEEDFVEETGEEDESYTDEGEEEEEDDEDDEEYQSSKRSRRED